jgi:hypothetical protein
LQQIDQNLLPAAPDERTLLVVENEEDALAAVVNPVTEVLIMEMKTIPRLSRMSKSIRLKVEMMTWTSSHAVCRITTAVHTESTKNYQWSLNKTSFI